MAGETKEFFLAETSKLSCLCFLYSQPGTVRASEKVLLNMLIDDHNFYNNTTRPYPRAINLIFAKRALKIQTIFTVICGWIQEGAMLSYITQNNINFSSKSKPEIALGVFTIKGFFPYPQIVPTYL